MGEATGFLKYDRKDKRAELPKKRIKHYREFHTALSQEEQQIQGARCMECGVPFCHSGQMISGMVSGCPLHNLVPEWNDLIYRDNWKEAYNRLIKTNNFPEFTSRVCPALCEAACTCGLNGSPVAVKSNEYGIIEYAYEAGYVEARPPKVRTGKNVAVIGSGPAGLAAADQLNRRGHRVTIFERADRPGGLLRYGIPNMKLEKEIIDRKIDIMKAEGVQFILNCNVGKDKKATALLKEYDRVLLACGASSPRDVKVTGRDAKGIHFAVDFLTDATKNLATERPKAGDFISAKGKKVLVIGGGDTGNDCVGTAIRQGAKSVIQLEMMPKPPEQRDIHNPWPEWPRVLKTDYGQEEAIAVFGADPRVYETTVKEFMKDKEGNVSKARLIRLTWEKDPQTGRMQMKEEAKSEYEMEVDLVLIAAGFLGIEAYVTKAFGVTVDERNCVETKPSAYATNITDVFTAGDMHRGQSLVVWAIREGREAAKAVDRSLMGYSNL